MKSSVSCVNSYQKLLSLNLAVSQNCRLLTHKCTMVRAKKNLQERKLEKHQLAHPKSLKMRFTGKYKCTRIIKIR